MAGSDRRAVGAALIVGGSILAGSWMVQSALDRTSSQLEAIKTGLEQTKSALETVAKGKAAAPPRRGPDPNKRYTIRNNGAPAKGPHTAKVKIFEFSDFQ